MLGDLGGMFGALVTGIFYLLLIVGAIGGAWYYKKNVSGYPYKVTLEERRGNHVVTSIHKGRFEEKEGEMGKKLVFKMAGFPQDIQQIDYSHIQPDNSIRIYRAGQNEFRPVLVSVSEEDIGFAPLVDPSWERSWADTVERVVRMRSEHNWLKEYAWVAPLGVCLIFMMVVAVAVLDGMSKATAALTDTANAWRGATAAQVAASSPSTPSSLEKPPVIFALVGGSYGR